MLQAPDNLDFRVLNSYELPKQFLSMALEGQLNAKSTLRGMKEVLSGEPLLSPLERSRLSDQVKQAFGLENNRALDAFLEVATNPLSYLAFLPSMGTSVRAALGSAKKSSWMRRDGTVLAALGLEGGISTFRGTSIPPILSDLVMSMKRSASESEALWRPGYEKMLRTLQAKNPAIKDITGRGVMRPGPEQDARRRLDALLQTYLEGLNKDVPTKTFRGVDKGAAGAEIKFSTGTRPKLIDMTDEQLERALDDMGALEFARGLKADQQRVAAQIFGTTPDERARNAARLYYSTRGVANSKSHENAAAAKVAMQSLFGKDMEDDLAKGVYTYIDAAGKKVQQALTEDDWIKLVNDAIDVKLSDPHFMSRNMYTSRDAMGRILRPDNTNSAMYDHGLVPTGSTLPRTTDNFVFGEDDLDLLRRLQREITGNDTVTQGWASQYAQSTKYNADLVDNPNIRRRINAIDSHGRYVQNMHATKALFIEDVSPEALIMEKEALDAFKNELIKSGQPLPAGTLRTIGARNRMPDDILTPVADLDGTTGPLHGYTRADLLDRAYRLIPGENRVTRDLFKNGLLPHMLGEGTEKSFTSGVLAAKYRDMATWFMGTDAYKIIDGLGGPAKYLSDGIRHAATTDMPVYAGASWQHRAANHLFGATLGVNIKSVLFNLTQPLITMPSFATFREMAEGYGNGIRKMTNYYADAFQTKGAFTDPTVMRNIRRKHFDLVDTPTGDLLGLTEDLMDQLDLGQAGARVVLEGNKMTWAQKVMIPFQQGEISNRVITSEIVRARLKRQGLDPFSKDLRTRALAQAEIQTLVQETQFGSSGLNTIAGAYGQGSLGKFLSQPLLRQFLTFPLRMMTLPFSTLSRLDDRGWLAAGAALGRTVGYSAIAYELLRSDLIPGIGGMDASDFLVVGGTTQLISGAVDGKDGILPVPPAMSLATNMVRGMTTGDFEMMSNEAWKFVPGGIAIGRAVKQIDPLGFIRPDAMKPGQGLWPYNRVGWQEQDENGEVPIYNPQGQLLTRARPLDLVLRGAGLDMKQFQNTGELDNFLVKQRDQMVQYERQIVQATLNGDHGRAQQLAAEFRKRFGFAPKIERSQFQTALKNRELDRTERILSRMDPEIRELYGQIAERRRGQPIQSADNEQLRGEAGVAQAALNDIMMRIGQ